MDDVGGNGGVVVSKLLASGEWDGDGSWLLLLLLLLLLDEYGGGGGRCRGCCWAAINAIVVAYDGGSDVGTVGDALPLLSTGGVVGGDEFCCCCGLP